MEKRLAYIQNMKPDETYHVYNHANGRENLFDEYKNYQFFLGKLSKYILPVCEIYAYCLLPNHFHLLIRIKSECELLQLWQSFKALPKLTPKQVENKISKTFANCFSSYTQSFNKMYNRQGSLFIPSMKQEIIDDENYFLKVVHYIHANPVHHGFTRRIEDWDHSSYKTFLSSAPTKLDRSFVLNEFEGVKQFIRYHQQPIDLKIKTFK